MKRGNVQCSRVDELVFTPHFICFLHSFILPQCEQGISAITVMGESSIDRRHSPFFRCHLFRFFSLLLNLENHSFLGLKSFLFRVGPMFKFQRLLTSIVLYLSHYSRPRPLPPLPSHSYSVPLSIPFWIS